MPDQTQRRMTALLIQVTNALAMSGAAMAPIPVLLDGPLLAEQLLDEASDGQSSGREEYALTAGCYLPLSPSTARA